MCNLLLHNSFSHQNCKVFGIQNCWKHILKLLLNDKNLQNKSLKIQMNFSSNKEWVCQKKLSNFKILGCFRSRVPNLFFLDPSSRKHTIHANITETYPQTPPVWFSESENTNVTNALTSLSETSGLNNHLFYQVKSLLRQLCTSFTLPLPEECADSNLHPSGPSSAQ